MGTSKVDDCWEGVPFSRHAGEPERRTGYGALPQGPDRRTTRARRSPLICKEADADAKSRSMLCAPRTPTLKRRHFLRCWAALPPPALAAWVGHDMPEFEPGKLSIEAWAYPLPGCTGAGGAAHRPAHDFHLIPLHPIAVYRANRFLDNFMQRISWCGRDLPAE